MGNPQHLEWLLEGVEAWNKRREEEPSLFPQFDGADIRQIFIDSGIIGTSDRLPFAGINFSNASLMEANLRGA